MTTRHWMTGTVVVALVALSGCMAEEAPSEESTANEAREDVGVVQSELSRDPGTSCTCPPFTEPLGQICWVTSKLCLPGGVSYCTHRCEPIDAVMFAQ